ncbi:TonB-dependent receptor [Pedobacter sp. MC2016-24]|uniref:TonB-dependent receptor n=1 Tax=Pedobacter sp. MC2016-24 TaxID=2780090 RepID=UPI00187E5519|nr:TonB-dependent receptor [Pedobacter sp. MC2016-24]MBE9599834.1 TonB-dependent receptor [Pedobacter sp. MC2016-24]
MLLSCQGLYAQSAGSLSGSVVSESGIKIPNVLIRFSSKKNNQYSDTEGMFKVSSLPKGDYEIVLSAIGFANLNATIKINSGMVTNQQFVLKEQVQELNEVGVFGKNDAKRSAEQAYQVAVIDARKLHNTTLNIAHALNNVPGIRVRESGGLGSDVDFSLNGFIGNQVKFFIDGIPMENMGNAFRINNIPINMAERIEVYKGVVPVTLGADALGGAINIVTNSGRTNYLDASYAVGSFNTHKASLNLASNSKSGFTLMINAFQNYSKNNYWIESETPVNQYGQVELVRARRFHDRYKNEMLMLGLGVRNKTWADQLIFGIDFGRYVKDIQSGATMEDVYGERESKGVTILPSVKYLKRNLLLKGMDLNVSGNFNFGHDRIIDTANRQYNWLGQVIRKSAATGSERSRMDSRYRNNDGVFTSNLSYRINERHSLVLSNNYTTFKRVNHDLLPDGNDQFANRPNTIVKNVLGISYRYDHSAKWSTSVFGKYFHQTSRSFMNVNGVDNPRHEDYDWRSNVFSTKGYGLATTYFITPVLQVRSSYEKGVRVPTSGELFGNMNELDGNIQLKPESSDNINLGMIYSPVINKTHFFIFDAAFLYRNSKDFIRPSLLKTMRSTLLRMVNLRDVDNKGLEASIRYRFKNKINLGTNISYQNLINRTKYEGGHNDMVSIVYKDRIPNMPYLFGNADASYTFNKPFGTDGTLTFGYQLQYVHAYYEGWPSLGDRSGKITIPKQWNHNANMIYSFKGGKYNLTVESLNLTDALLYDHFKLQKPSRAFNAKLRYFLFNAK